MYNIEEIQEKFNQVILESQGFDPNTDSLFQDWHNNKKWFIENFGNDLIVDCGPVSFALDKEEKNRRISEFLDYVDFEYHLYDLTNFIDEQRDTFYDNETCKEYCYRDIKIPKGAKLVKAFKHFITNKELLKTIQDRASMVIQDDKIHGNLCFSVHPLDYLSLSETTYKWRSCHALDGEYRAGNLSYMADSSTVICYLRGEEDQKLPHFPETVLWNSKKWRCLLFFSRERSEIFFGRQYPMFSEEAMAIMSLELQKEEIIETGWTPPYNDCISHHIGTNGHWSFDTKYYPIRGFLYGIDDIVKDQGDLHYNDLLRSSCYTKPYLMVNDWQWNQKVQFDIGNEVMCLNCGKLPISPGEEGTMLCCDCQEGWDQRTYWCDYCGDSHDEDEMYFIDGLTICPKCLPEKTSPCTFCGAFHLNQFSFVDFSTNNKYCSEFCFKKGIKQEEEKERVENGEGTNSQEQDSREAERGFWVKLPW